MINTFFDDVYVSSINWFHYRRVINDHIYTLDRIYCQINFTTIVICEEKEKQGSLAGIAQLVGSLSHPPKGRGLHDWSRFNPQSGHMWEATNPYSLSLHPSL